MKKTRRTLIIIAMAALGTGAQAQMTENCGRVTLADMNWDSATLLAHVDRFILEHGFGCDTELVAGDTVPTGTSMMERGEPDIASELWTNAIAEPLAEGVAEGRLSVAGDVIEEGGIEGLWVPEYLAEEYPELTTIEGILEHRELFEHPEDPDKYAVYGCPAGWTCQITVRNNFKALGLAEKGFELVDPGSPAGLSGAIARAYERQEPWFGYYWSPTSLLGQYPMQMVDFGSGIHEEHYRNCTVEPDCLDPKVTMWPSSPVQTVTTGDLAERAPGAYDYLATRSFTNAEINEVIAWMGENQADGEYAMDYFMVNYEDMWRRWLPAGPEQQVADALGL